MSVQGRKTHRCGRCGRTRDARTMLLVRCNLGHYIKGMPGLWQWHCWDCRQGRLPLNGFRARLFPPS